MKKIIIFLSSFCALGLTFLGLQPKGPKYVQPSPAVLKRGYNVLRQIMSTSYKFVENDIRKKHSLYPQYNFDSNLEDIISVCHTLMDMAEKKDTIFARGSFSLVDIDAKIYDFFLEYVKITSTSYGWPYIPTYKQSWIWYSPAYFRTSSHYRKQKTGPQFGIDIYDKILKKSIPALPIGNKKHILFGRVVVSTERQKTFIKFEPFGMGRLFECIKHALTWFWIKFSPLPRSEWNLPVKREKDIPPEIAQSYEQMFDEKAPKIPFIDFAEHVRQFSKKLKTLSRKITEKTPRSGAWYRTGNEVVLDPSRLLRERAIETESK